ncbi:MAG: type II secretion system F family protein [Bacilli bacterium]|nr:type II secretion system F family protein [Bacilli bacterium]
MNQYKYVAMNLQHEKFTGVFIAENESDLSVQLQKQGLFLVSAKLYTGSTPNSFFSLSSGKVSISELNTFCRQFAIMINSGIPIIGCLDILKEQKYTKLLKDILVIINDDVRGGMMFSDALNKHKKIFPNFFRSMVAVGEKSGKMDVVLNSLADYYENDARSKKNIKSAFSYPIMLAIMTVGIVIVMLAFVVPTFRKSLSSLSVNPTGITKIVYDTSDFIVNYGLYVLGGVVVLGLLIFAISRTEKGRLFFDKAKMTTPGIKGISVAVLSARFSRAFGLLLTSGMDIIEAMEAVIIVFDNKYIEKKFKLAIEDVKHGSGLATTFEKYQLFPSILSQMVSIGEKTNSLDDVLTRSCSFFDEQVNASIMSITSKTQPIMLGIMGGIIGFLFIGIYSPMLDIMKSFGA